MQVLWTGFQTQLREYITSMSEVEATHASQMEQMEGALIQRAEEAAAATAKAAELEAALAEVRSASGEQESTSRGREPGSRC